MKVLMLNYEFPPLGGGAANANLHLLKEFQKIKGLEIDLITSSTGKYKKEKFSKNITIHYLNIGKSKDNLHFQTHKDLLVYAYKSQRYSKKLLKEKNFDIIHAWFGIPSGVTSLFLKKPFIVSLRGSDVPFYNKRFLLLDIVCFQHISKFVWKRSKYVVANSEGLKKLAQKTAPNQEFKVIPNGVDTNYFKPSKNADKKNAILFVGRLIKRKGVEELINAFAKLEKYIKDDWKVWLAGNGPEMENLKKLSKKLGVEKSIKFFGRLDKEDLLKKYQSASVFALPSKNEGMSNAVLEAMACGLPIIATDTGGTKELVDKTNGIVVPKDDVSKLSKSLKELIDDPRKREAMSASSNKKSKNKSWKHIADNYRNIYNNSL